MGVYQSKFKFPAPPDLNAVYAEARRRLGDIDGIESLIVEGDVVIALSMMDAFTHPVVCAILEEMGGQSIPPFRSELGGSPAPAWAHAPISELAWLERMAIRLGWWSWLFGNARR